MGKVKLRVSSILPDSLSKWFSPTADPNAAGAAAVAGEESSSSTSPQLPLSQHNGSALTTTIKQKHSRRRIQLEADDAPDIAVDDGTNAQDLNEEEVQLADNIAEHDLAGEDEQTRRSEYNVSLLRKRQLVANEDDDDDDDEDAEEEDDDEADDGPQPLNYRSQQPNRSVNFRSSAAQPLQKRKRMEVGPSDHLISLIFIFIDNDTLFEKKAAKFMCRPARIIRKKKKKRNTQTIT